MPVWKKEFFEDGSVWKENAEARRLLAAVERAEGEAAGGGGVGGGGVGRDDVVGGDDCGGGGGLMAVAPAVSGSSLA